MMLISRSAKPFGSRIWYCMWLKSAKIGKFAAGYACMTAGRYFMCSSMLPNSKKARFCQSSGIGGNGLSSKLSAI